ncbi:MAG: hypothetical protein LBV32_06145 [Tannerellaceae bacterium]|jgi:hypothetical protein|nr:hypothetical protein [Tannerellaceae bacterium]
MFEFKNKKSRHYIFLTVLVFFLLREAKIEDYNPYSLILSPILLTAFMWKSMDHRLKEKFNRVIIFCLASFCLFGEKTLISFIIPFACGLLTWGIFAFYEYKKRKQSLEK